MNPKIISKSYPRFKPTLEKYSGWSKNLEYKLFLIGIFFLASAPFISSILLIFPLLKGLIKTKVIILSDKKNYPLIIASLLMIIKCILDSYYPPLINDSWDAKLSWIGLFNWIPLFLCYFGFQPYLMRFEQRLLISKVFIASTIPLLISGLSQYFLKIYGPFDILNGLIIWYQRPIDFANGSGLTSVFNNPNYTGIWLTLIWPFCLGFFIINKKSKSRLDTFLMFFLCVCFVISAVLTNSRAAWLNLIIAIPIVLGRASLFWLIPILFFIIISILFTFIPIINFEIQSFFRVIIPQKIWLKFSELILDISNFPRIRIWSYAMFLISSRPFLGWGGASFPILFYSYTGLSNNHSHNLFLELSLGYGIIVSTLVFTTIIQVLYLSFKKLAKTKNSIEIINNKSWWAASFIFFTSHIYDITYYDLRISMASWICLAGLKCI